MWTPDYHTLVLVECPIPDVASLCRYNNLRSSENAFR